MWPTLKETVHKASYGRQIYKILYVLHEAGLYEEANTLIEEELISAMSINTF